MARISERVGSEPISNTSLPIRSIRNPIESSTRYCISKLYKLTKKVLEGRITNQHRDPYSELPLSSAPPILNRPRSPQGQLFVVQMGLKPPSSTA